MKIEITREELELIRRALDFLKRDNEELIETSKEVGWYGAIELFEKDNKNVNELRNKLTSIVYGDLE